MRKENISIAYDSEKLSAVKMYMEQRDTDLKSEMEKSLDALYTKYVEEGENRLGREAVPLMDEPDC